MSVTRGFYRPYAALPAIVRDPDESADESAGDAVTHQNPAGEGGWRGPGRPRMVEPRGHGTRHGREQDSPGPLRATTPSETRYGPVPKDLGRGRDV
ncbi:hypothetical protein GCM10011584_01370 [Nocardioides phosphati]|uniref:Uncharacterized protein n=1 Tax=Nocardioides phosphati TaxID=1867775 RepID=A0ABQ2N6W0_9ACTN|nr:hypothetical protein GCM10011584_01370 [Nocardioides phosphati]